jgi:hypothetical protein
LDYRGPLERTNSTRSPASDRHNGLIDLFRPNYFDPDLPSRRC